MTVIPREQHAISRKDISENALKVLYRLNKAGYEAYLVGGGVRDLLLGKKPKDFDVTTSATPEQVRKLFRNCRLVGRRFRLAHVMFGPEIIEVATFRGHHEAGASDRTTSQRGQNGMLLRDNIFGSIEDDAQRRALLRGELGVTDQDILFGHVGRFSAQKNHPGLLKIFAAVRTHLPKARLVLLGGRVTVAARSPEQRANARCAGCRAAPLTALPTLLPGFDAVINTIPAPVLPRALLQQLPGGALIIDLASLPGGTDFAAAEELGLHAEHALALPGRCAPQTAGALIAQTVLAILEERDPDERSTAP